ncbi:MAG: helix-turn-helix transcriptional regulator [Desulfatiglandaceae bacterium]
MKKMTNFERYLEEELKDPEFKERFERAGEAWEVAMKLAALRKRAGLSQKELARKAGTTQQQISRMESPSYEGHSLSMLRRIAAVLGATVHVDIQQEDPHRQAAVAEARPGYGKDNAALRAAAVRKRAGRPVRTSKKAGS